MGAGLSYFHQPSSKLLRNRLELNSPVRQVPLEEYREKRRRLEEAKAPAACSIVYTVTRLIRCVVW
jgi:hypothetical protein